jgi:hypothetical protein
MPVPTSYSESQFAAYLVTTLDTLEQVLNWDQGDPRVREAVADALLDYGVSDIADATDIRKLRALGRRAIWRAVANATAGFYAFTDVGQQQFSRQQIHDHAVAMLKQAEVESLEWSLSYAASSSTISRITDPYIVLPDSERVA